MYLVNPLKRADPRLNQFLDFLKGVAVRADDCLEAKYLWQHFISQPTNKLPDYIVWRAVKNPAVVLQSGTYKSNQRTAHMRHAQTLLFEAFNNGH